MLRGLAILGIFYINVPYMAASVWTFSADVRLIGWTPADRDAWAAVNLFFAGTQRCLLEFLFGAGMMVLARKAMAPDGPVAVADLYYRRQPLAARLRPVRRVRAALAGRHPAHLCACRAVPLPVPHAGSEDARCPRPGLGGAHRHRHPRIWRARICRADGTRAAGGARRSRRACRMAQALRPHPRSRARRPRARRASGRLAALCEECVELLELSRRRPGSSGT